MLLSCFTPLKEKHFKVLRPLYSWTQPFFFSKVFNRMVSVRWGQQRAEKEREIFVSQWQSNWRVFWGRTGIDIHEQLRPGTGGDHAGGLISRRFLTTNKVLGKMKWVAACKLRKVWKVILRSVFKDGKPKPDKNSKFNKAFIQTLNLQVTGCCINDPSKSIRSHR